MKMRKYTAQMIGVMLENGTESIGKPIGTQQSEKKKQEPLKNRTTAMNI